MRAHAGTGVRGSQRLGIGPGGARGSPVTERDAPFRSAGARRFGSPVTPLAELAEFLELAPSLAVPSAYRSESRLPGAMDAWRSGLADELAVIQSVLFTPRPGASVRDPIFSMMAVNAAQRRIHDDVAMYTERFDQEPLGRRLRFLARSELASRAARYLVDATLVA